MYSRIDSVPESEMLETLDAEFGGAAKIGFVGTIPTFFSADFSIFFGSVGLADRVVTIS